MKYVFSDFITKCLCLNDPEKKYDRYDCDHVVADLTISPNSEYFTISIADGFVQVRSILKPAVTHPGSKKPLAKFKAIPQFLHIS